MILLAARTVLWLSTIALLAASACTWAQSAFPTRPIRIIAPAGPGTGTDTTTRLLAQGLSERLGGQVVVENRTGASAIMGAEIVATAPPDGHTLYMAGTALTINPSMYKKIPYDVLRDFAPVLLAARLPSLMVVHPSLPAKSVAQFIALSKTRPGEILFGSSGHGGNSHLSVELFASIANIKLVHVPYKSGAFGLVDLMSGQIGVMMPNIVGAIPSVRAGRLRALGVTSSTRSSAAPEIPTIAESGLPGYESAGWYGLIAPAATPREIISRLHRESVATLNNPKTKQILTSDGAEVVAGTPEEFSAFLKAEVAKWPKIIKEAGIQPQ